MKKLLLLLALSSPCFGQALSYVPPTFAAFVSSDGSGAPGTWNPLTGGGGTTALTYVPPAAALFVSNDGTGNPGTWVPWTGSGSGGAGVSSINGTTGAFTFTGAGVTCVSTTCTFTGTGSGITQLTGAVLAGPGSGSQATTISGLSTAGLIPTSNGSGALLASGITADTSGNATSAGLASFNLGFAYNPKTLSNPGAGDSQALYGTDNFAGDLDIILENQSTATNARVLSAWIGGSANEQGLFIGANSSTATGTDFFSAGSAFIFTASGLPNLYIGNEFAGTGPFAHTFLRNGGGGPSGIDVSGQYVFDVAFPFLNGAGGILATLPATGELALATTAQKTITLGTTALVLGSTVTSVAGLAVNGVTLNSTGSAASYLSQAGTYTPVTFDQIGSGTNLGHGLVCGAGCVISGTGGGFINANEINGTLMSGLVTGILKNTTSTGVPSIAVAADFPTLNQSTTGQSGTVNTIAGNVSFGSGLSTSGAGTLASPYVVTSSAGGGSVTSFSAGALSPLFTTSVATATTTPALTFTLTAAAQNSVFAGPATGGAGAPSYQTAPTFAVTNLTGTGGFSITGNAATATSATAATNLSGGLLGSIPYQSAANTTAFVAPNTTTARLFSSETGTGTVGAAPTLGLIGAADTGPSAYVVTTGAVNVLVATMSPAVPSLAAGLEIDILPNLANTSTTPTINVNGLGAKTITKNGTGALVAGDLSTTAIASLVYDGTEFQLVNPQIINATSVGGKLPSGSGTAIATANNSGMLPLELACFTNTGTAQLGQCGGVVLVGSENVVTFSTTPTFSSASTSNILTLTGTVTSSTWAAVTDAIPRTITICQDATGSRTFVPPANTHGFMTIGITANLCNSQSFTYSVAKTGWYATSVGVQNE